MFGEEGQRFSKRFGHVSEPAEITIREDAPPDLRYAVVVIAEHDLNTYPSTLRDILCRVLRTRPDPNHWSEYPNIWGEVQELISHCDWFRVYDVIEAIYSHLSRGYQSPASQKYAVEINECFYEMGIGWQLVDGRIETRGDDALESTLKSSKVALAEAGLQTAHSELSDALSALSRRPSPDLSGAVFHSLAALECTARDVSNDSKSTLGEIVKRHPDMFPKPLDEAVTKAWGFASEEARHAREGRDLEFADAQATVGLAATLCSYLLAKFHAPQV